MNDAQRVLNAFRPNQAMDDPGLFAGRHRQLEELCEGMHSKGSCPIILGDRGLGKTSLALQVQRIAQGDISLLTNDRLGDWAFAADDRYLTLFVSCTDTVETTTALLQRMINAIVETVPEPRDGAVQLVDRVTQHRVSLKLFESSFSATYQPAVVSTKYENLDLEEQVVRLAGYLSDLTGQPVLFVIDEVDRVKNTKGLAAFIKAASSPLLKFLLVGIGQTLAHLMADHESIERIAVPVLVPHMTPGELAEIVEQAKQRLHADKLYITVTTTAIRRLARLASGFPWFVHVLGQAAFLEAWRDGTRIVGDLHVADALRNLAKNRFAQQFADRYQVAVRDSEPREILLRAFAKWQFPDVPTADVYRLVNGLGVRNPSVYKGHLTQPQYGAVLVAPPFQQRGVVRFQNEMFKVYCRIRASIYADVDRRVDEAWAGISPRR